MPSAGPDDRPLVVVEKVRGALRIAALDARALQTGLAAGLTLADARARIPSLAVAELDAEADARLLEELALFCDRYTPLVALDPPHGLLLDITGCAHLFNSEPEMRRIILTRLIAMGFAVKAAIAGTPDAARALARFGRTGVVPQGRDDAFTRRLPIAALSGVAPESILALSRAGLRTLGDIADRPSSILAARFGAELVTSLMRTLGRECAPLAPLRPAPLILVDRHFPEPLTQADCLTATLNVLIGDAAEALRQRGEGGRTFEASLFRSDGAVCRLQVETARQTRDAAAIALLYRERIASLADPIEAGFGFDCVRLAVLATEPLAETEPHLDGRTLEEEAFVHLVDRLVARFGQDRVLRFEPRDTHEPDRDARLVSAGISQKASLTWPVPEPGEPPLRPLRLFDPPQPIEALAEVPDGPPLRFRWRRVLHEVASAEGPERIEREWWRVGPNLDARDYYRVEDARGHRFWIFRQGLYGGSGGAPRWYMHGLFA